MTVAAPDLVGPEDFVGVGHVLGNTLAGDVLRASALGGLLPGECIADLFCGAGGWGEGLKKQTDAVGVAYAVNHDRVAIAAHTENNPGCVHHQGDAWKARPLDVVAGSTLGVLFASAACTSHSRAKGGAPVSKRVHMLGWCIARWARELAPRVILLENVPEWKDWGPLIQARAAKGKARGRLGWAWRVEAPKGVKGRGANRKQIRGPHFGTPEGRAFARAKRAGGVTVKPCMVACPKRKGRHFRAFIAYLRKLGYVVEMRVMDAPDYGAASRRRRLFVIARRDGAPIVWPAPTHGPVEKVHHAVEADREGHRDRSREREHRGGDRRGGAASPEGSEVGGLAERLRPFRCAADVIDWTDLGTSIFERPRPLAPKTLERIAEGVRRYVLNDLAPFLLRVTQTGEGGGWKVCPVTGPMPTQTTRQDLAVCSPVIAPQNTGVFGQRPDAPGPSITTKGHQGLATPILTRFNGEKPGDPANVHRVDSALPTVPTENRFGVATPILATTGYGERAGQALRVHQVAELLGTCVNGAKQGLATPVAVAAASLMNNTTHHPGGRMDGPAPTVTTGGQCGLVAPVLSHMRHGGGQATRADLGLPAVTAGGNHAGLVAALLTEYYGSGSGQTGRRVTEPTGAVTTLDRHGLVCVVIDGVQFVIVDILFRMLRVHELAAAMGFPTGYRWPKAQRDATRLIGNAVHVDQAKALIGAAMPGLRPPAAGLGERRERVA